MNYNEPGNISELPAGLVKKWQAKQSEYFDDGIVAAKREASPPSSKAWFFNPLTDWTDGVTTADIRWNAFPRRLLDTFGSKVAAWRDGDRSRNRHEEYCEWEVVRDATEVITRVTFTTETFEYYELLFNEAPDLLLALYHQHVSNQVTLADLRRPDGSYDRANKWNMPELQGKRGVLMHMGFGPNTLQAAIALSAEATWPSVGDNGALITDEQGLIDCRGYGARERHSDPHIGAEINALVRAGNEVSFAGPTGLYIDSIDLSGFEVPNDVAAADLMRIVRGDKDHMMRVVFEAPADSGFKLGDVKVDGNPLRFGGQIAEKLTIRIRGIARPATSKAPTISCSGSISPQAEAVAPASATFSRRVSLEYLVSSE